MDKRPQPQQEPSEGQQGGCQQVRAITQQAMQGIFKGWAEDRKPPTVGEVALHYHQAESDKSQHQANLGCFFWRAGQTPDPAPPRCDVTEQKETQHGKTRIRPLVVFPWNLGQIVRVLRNDFPEATTDIKRRLSVLL